MPGPAADPELYATPLGGLPRKTTRDGYVLVRVASAPRRWEGEHRMVLAQMLGRPLERGERAGHRNGDRADNRPENLELRRAGAATLAPPPAPTNDASTSTRCPACGCELELVAVDVGFK